jgi:hypothetical protein
LDEHLLFQGGFAVVFGSDVRTEHVGSGYQNLCPLFFVFGFFDVLGVFDSHLR